MSFHAEITPALIGESVALFLLMAAAVADVRHRVIPNIIPVALMMLFIAQRLISEDTNVMPYALSGASALAGGYILYHFGLIGAGDAKLFAAICLYLGPSSVPHFLLLTGLSGGVLALAYIAKFRLLSHSQFLPSLPYGVALAAGGAVAILL